MNPIRLVIADDQAMIRAGLALVLDSEPDIDVVGHCGNGRELIDIVASTHPDLILTDIRMPVMDGIEAATRLRATPGAPPILALTTFDDDDVLWPTLTAGVEGFVLKDSPAEALITAVRTVATGGTWIDPRVLPRVITRATRTGPDHRPDTGTLDRLTPRERQVLDLLCQGASNAELALHLHSSERTIKAHITGILQKLDARDRASAIVTAYESGWRRPPL